MRRARILSHHSEAPRSALSRLPKAPELLKAYDTRASEIVEHTSKLQRNQTHTAKTLFADQLGIDSTSVWAAATSSQVALQMHLLACLLARIWPQQEATAIWVELVANRQRQIRDTIENGGAVNLDGLAATAYVIEQSSLAEWDASARSWLEIADKAKKKQQVQTRLIVDNLSVGISHIGDINSSHRYLYQNVLKNYEEAISAMDKPIRGSPQRINSANALLGLTAWHLYPGLVVLGIRVVDIIQEDNQVIAGGVATIRFAEALDHHHDANPDGVYWSLPLASLRYYGTVKSTRSSFRDSTRLSVVQLQLLALGAYLDAECLKAFPVVSEIIVELQSMLMESCVNEAKEKQPSSSPTGNDDSFSWRTPEISTKLRVLRILSCFSKGANLYLSGSEVDRKMALKLVKYGFRHGKDWLGVSKTTPPLQLFSLTILRNVLAALKGPLERVTLLRKVFKQTRVPSKGTHLRFLDAEGKKQSFAMQELPITSGNSEENNGIQPTKRKRTRQTLADYYEAKGLENRVFVGTSGVPDAGISFLSSRTDGELNDALEEWFHEYPGQSTRLLRFPLRQSKLCSIILEARVKNSKVS